MSRGLAIVFTPDFSSSLEKLAFHTPVWLADTPANRSAAERSWHAAIEWPHLSVVLFRAPAGPLSEEDWRTLLQQVSLRERFDTLEAIGAELTPSAQVALAEAGFIRVEATQGGFRARK